MWNDVWEKVFTTQAWGKYPAEPLIRFIARNFYDKERKSVRILELGCGPGANLWFMAREGFSFVGLEGSGSAVEQAERRLDAECIGWRERGRIETADITRIDFGNDCYDAVIDNECVYCMPFETSREIYAKALRALKPNGKIFVRTFTPEKWGYQTGKKISDDTYECTEGPLTNKGASRFTSMTQIPELLVGYTEFSIEKTVTTYMNGAKSVSEWIIEAKKQEGGPE